MVFLELSVSSNDSFKDFICTVSFQFKNVVSKHYAGVGLVTTKHLNITLWCAINSLNENSNYQICIAQ